MERVKRAIMQVKPRDIVAPLIFLLMLIPSLIFRLVNKLKHRKLWLVAEQGEARDNGYHFYKYVRERHPSDYCFYAINPESAGYKKVEKLGNVIKWGSLKHWLYYMSANLNISSQKSGNPAPIFWYVMHVRLGLYDNRVFLQHGITKDDSKWLYYDQTHFKYFVCGAKREYDYILEKFGYKKENLLLTGFPRWDNLKDISKEQKNKSILIMPTWRNWLGGDTNKVFTIKDFLKTDYYKKWSEIINDKEFIEYIEKNKIDVYFYPHIHMQKFLSYFASTSRNIKIVSCDSDIQKYFNKCSLMITDYSSVAFDFAYLEKPVIYYQFDLEEYRRKQLQEGYYDYRKDGFGPVVENEKELIESIKKITANGLNSRYKERFDSFFAIRKDNSECLYGILSKSHTISSREGDDISFSIILPTYNNCEAVTKSVNNILNVDYDKFELIVVNDGSTDNTRSSLSRNKDQKFILLSQKNMGVSAARNAGIKKASGEYIIFVDDDDELKPESLKILAKTIVENNKPDYIRYAGIRQNEDGTETAIKGFDNRELLNQIINPNCKVDCFAWLLAVKREKVRLFREKLKYMEDDAFYMDNLIGRDVSFISIPDKLYIYKYNKNGKTKDANKLEENLDDLINTAISISGSTPIKTNMQERMVCANLINMIYWRTIDARLLMDEGRLGSIVYHALKKIEKLNLLPSPFFFPKQYMKLLILRRYAHKMRSVI